MEQECIHIAKRDSFGARGRIPMPEFQLWISLSDARALPPDAKTA